MSLTAWMCGICIFLGVFALLRLHSSLRYAKRTLPESVLRDEVKSADEYEIALLKGGRRFAFDLAFCHLVKAGYLEKGRVIRPMEPLYRFKASADKDSSLLSGLEREVLATFSSFKPWSSGTGSLQGAADELRKETPSMESYRRKAARLFLCYAAGPAHRVLAALFLLFVLGGGISVVASSWDVAWCWLTVFLVVCASVAAVVVYFRVFEKKACVPAVFWFSEDYRADHVLTDNGNKYVELFEKEHYVLPHSDDISLLKEASDFSPCSV